MARWSIDYRDDLDSLERLFETVGENKLDEAFRVAGRTLVSLAQRGFDTGSDPYGRRWTPLAAETIRQKSSSKPLVDTGRLRNSIDYNSERDSVELYTDVPYAVYHQGTLGSSGGRTLPRRPFLPDDRGLPDRWRRVIFDAIEDLIE